MEIDFGWGRKPFREQLAASGINADHIEHADKDADAIVRLHIRSLITDKMRDYAMKNVIRRLGRAPRAST